MKYTNRIFVTALLAFSIFSIATNCGDNKSINLESSQPTNTHREKHNNIGKYAAVGGPKVAPLCKDIGVPLCKDTKHTIALDFDDKFINCEVTYSEFHQKDGPTYKDYIDLTNTSLVSLTGPTGQTKRISFTLKDGYELDQSQLSFFNDEGKEYDGKVKYIDRTTIDVTFGTFNVNLKCRSLGHWYNCSDWWNYCSDGEIQATSDEIGTTVPITLNVNGNYITHLARLIGVDHDNKASGGKAHCTFEFVNVITKCFGLPYEVQWNRLRKSYSECFVGSHLYYALLKDEIFQMFPNDLISKISEVTKKSYDNKKDKLKSFNTKLFALTINEMIDGTYGTAEGKIYKYYQDRAEVDNFNLFTKYTVPMTDREISYSYTYWLRSTYYPYAVSINENGEFYCNDVDEFIAVAPAFCI